MMRKSFKLRLARGLLAFGVTLGLTAQALGDPAPRSCPPGWICPVPVTLFPAAEEAGQDVSWDGTVILPEPAK
ncbi:hypothetical protein [Frigidibacter sp. ROC022]|uniref:hypothetical protein n=1 Tax=Frigidibacter sp. ROC022 TaxID=2971796 RepID=UPI00215A12EA|nr:hypothetical protein [Frigidibacter sp. ROC022]MCR8723832.1 hypothetical protein [Frigidibacter sp. ROC022]